MASIGGVVRLRDYRALWTPGGIATLGVHLSHPLPSAVSASAHAPGWAHGQRSPVKQPERSSPDEYGTGSLAQSRAVARHCSSIGLIPEAVKPSQIGSTTGRSERPSGTPCSSRERVPDAEPFLARRPSRPRSVGQKILPRERSAGAVASAAWRSAWPRAPIVEEQRKGNARHERRYNHAPAEQIRPHRR